MKFFLFLPLFLYSSFALSLTCPLQPSDIKQETKLSQEIQDLYQSSLYLGVAVVDHQKFPGFAVLQALVETYGLDPKLKTIVIEDSAVFAAVYEKLSLNEPDTYLKNVEALPKTAQFEYLSKNILPLVREINKKRSMDPLLVVPVDSMDDSSAKMQMHYGDSVFRPEGTENIFSDLGYYHFVMSINREKQTADNFHQQIQLRYPQKKSIIIYHAAHIFDELWAYGYEVQGQTTEIRFDYLGWMGFLISQNPQLKKNYKKILVDASTLQNPRGSICWPDHLFTSEMKNSWFSTNVQRISQFNTDSFFGRYREGTISLQAESLADFYVLSTY